MTAIKKKPISPSDAYTAFEQLNGSHPWREGVPEGLILYPVRQLSGGKVSYFNFTLAKEMGLIPLNHPEKINKHLHEKILSTFCLRIINEFDQRNKLRVASHLRKPNFYMATRYLQIQHSDKKGRTSGDGRCIWNGMFCHNGKAWDVSSRGTGVTLLAPGAVQAGKPLQSGNTDFGYGCGMAEIDELFGAAILAEIFHRNGIATERVLAIIDLGKGMGIGVRAAPNLLRPAHLFSFLKQGKQGPLKRATDCFIDRQIMNGAWRLLPNEDRYMKFLENIIQSFAQFAARLDRDYIFAWLEWDGDNVLADAGIIDYGSVRQFGLRHDDYRYDDVDRFSTNLNEQRQKARDIAQTFVQLVDFIKSGKRKPRQQFSKSSWLKKFDKEFKDALLNHFLFQMGLPDSHRRLLMNKHRQEVENLFSLHSELERVKTNRKLHKVPDGVHRPAILNMRNALAQMARWASQNNCPVPVETLSAWMVSMQATRRDRKLNEALKKKMQKWQANYFNLLYKVTSPANWRKTMRVVMSRAEKINHSSRITGNALINVVDDILRFRRRGLSDSQIQSAIESLIDAQTLNPDYKPILSSQSPMANRSRNQSLLKTFLTVIEGYREDI